MGATLPLILPLITTLIEAAPGAVTAILSILHPDGSTTITILTQASQNDATAMAAISQLNAAVAAKSTASATATVAKPVGPVPVSA
jgi:hypothetical protein